MLQTTNIPYDESQVLDVFFPVKWHSPISQKDLMEFEIKGNETHKNELSIKDFEPIIF